MVAPAWHSSAPILCMDDDDEEDDEVAAQSGTPLPGASPRHTQAQVDWEDESERLRIRIRENLGY